MAQIDLDGTSIPVSPFIDNSDAYNSYHVPAGNNRQSRASEPAPFAGNTTGIKNLVIQAAGNFPGPVFSNPA